MPGERQGRREAMRWGPQGEKLLPKDQLKKCRALLLVLYNSIHCFIFLFCNLDLS